MFLVPCTVVMVRPIKMLIITMLMVRKNKRKISWVVPSTSNIDSAKVMSKPISPFNMEIILKKELVGLLNL